MRGLEIQSPISVQEIGLDKIGYRQFLISAVKKLEIKMHL